MNINKMYPIVTVDSVDPIRDFYTKHFNFAITFDGSGYLGFKAEGEKELEIAFMTLGDDSQAPFDGKGITLTMEVENVDDEFTRLSDAGITIVQKPKDNPWGDRAMIALDPVGVALYICQTIPMDEEFQKYVKH